LRGGTRFTRRRKEVRKTRASRDNSVLANEKPAREREKIVKNTDTGALRLMTTKKRRRGGKAQEQKKRLRAYYWRVRVRREGRREGAQPGGRGVET